MSERIAFLNTFLLYPEFIFRNGQSVRIPHILPFIRKFKPSVIGLSEVFRGFCKKMKNESIRNGYDFIYPSEGIFLQNSGLMFLFKSEIWRPLSFYKETFNDYTGSDRLAYKGFLMVKLLHKETNQNVYFILTHLNADQYQSATTQKVQMKQLEQIQTFIKERIPKQSKIVIMGDFNIDKIKSPPKLFKKIESFGCMGDPHEFTTNEWSSEGEEILDYIILKNIKGKSTKTIGYEKRKSLSDHNLIIRDIYLK